MVFINAFPQVPDRVWQNAEWVPKAYAIDNADKFDAAFFGIGPTEAKVMDPQHRVFMQCAWEAMESAGYPPRTGSDTRTGVFAAAGIDGYMHHHLDGAPLKDPLNPGMVFLGEVGSEKDYIATRVSYATFMLSCYLLCCYRVILLSYRGLLSLYLGS